MRVASQTAKEAMLCEVKLLEPAETPGCKSELEFVILLRWALKHDEVGKERKPHSKLQRKLIDPTQKRPSKPGAKRQKNNKRSRK